MKTKYKIGIGVILVAALVAVTGWYLSRHTIAVLQPAGKIGTDERNLMILCISISGGIVIPVFGLLGYFAWKYREGNRRAKYDPEFGGSKLAETIWWLVPSVLLVIIATITWQSSYALDPFKPLKSNKPTMHIQVVAMDWKWLFIYPDQHIARVNAVDVPVGTPVEFDITSDTVMTSFWVPQLGGQMYAMPGMTTKLNLVADKPGNYSGVAANISGKGFADMTFTVHALPAPVYNDWLQVMHRLPKHLTSQEYARLSAPSVVTQPTEHDNGYSAVEPGLYDTITMKYMMPMGGSNMKMEGNE